MDKRRYPRIVVRNMNVDVADGIGSCSGTVSDVSRHGLCVRDLAVNVGRRAGSYTVVVSHGNRFFKFRARPRWERADRVYKRMGLEIAEAPARWTDYVRSLEPVGPKRG